MSEGKNPARARNLAGSSLTPDRDLGNLGRLEDPFDELTAISFVRLREQEAALQVNSPSGWKTDSKVHGCSWSRDWEMRIVSRLTKPKGSRSFRCLRRCVSSRPWHPVPLRLSRRRAWRPRHKNRRRRARSGQRGRNHRPKFLLEPGKFAPAAAPSAAPAAKNIISDRVTGISSGSPMTGSTECARRRVT